MIVIFMSAFCLLRTNNTSAQGAIFCEAFVYLNLDDSGNHCLEPYDMVTVYSPPLDSFFNTSLELGGFSDSTWILSRTTTKGGTTGLKFTCEDLGGPIRFFYIDTISNQLLCWTDAFIIDRNIPEICDNLAIKNITDPFPSSTTHTASSGIVASNNTIEGNVTFQAPDSISICPSFTVLNKSILTLKIE